MNSKGNFIEVYATYSDIFGEKFDKDKLISMIYDLPLGGVINILSMLNARERSDTEIRARFYSFLKNSPNADYIIQGLEGRTLYTSQGLLSIWKWLLTYGDFNKMNEWVDPDQGIFIVLYLHLILGDYLYSSESEENDDAIIYELFSNLNFNSQLDVYSAFGRACVIYDEIAKDTSNFSTNEYMDINLAFENKYGYSIKEYLACLFSIVATFDVAKQKIQSSGARDINYFKQFSNNVRIDEIMEQLSVNINNAREWSIKNVENSWNFQLFKEKPLIKLNNGFYLPFSLRFLHEQVYSQLFFKIRECFPKDDGQIISFIGRCFEKYVEIITEEALKVSNIKYETIPEFRFKNDRSPDFMVRLGGKLLAVEAKNRRLKLDSIINRNQETIDSDVKNMIEEPIMQLHKCLKKLFERKHQSVVGVDEIYLVVVTQGSISTLPNFMKDIENHVFGEFEIPVKAIYHFDIEEYEYLLGIVGKKGAKPIFRILNDKTNLAPYVSFKNYLYMKSYINKRLAFIGDKFKHYTNIFENMLTGKTGDSGR
ncbi:hypothetical protein [Paenibacillus tundrae]|uniref:hypothetical protein n=1 Tax=Paenibacillus tundrae TaxID=528187 RepID=UPI0030CDE562